MPSEEQVLFAQHLLAWLRSLPPSYPVGMTAGSMLAKLEQLPGGKGGERPAQRTLACRRLKQGEGRQRVEEYLAASSEPLTATEIADGAGVNLGSVYEILKHELFERDQGDVLRFRLRKPVAA